MDKIYLLSSDEALNEFKKNPRPFLLPPQPIIPCKLAVLGPPLSGKSSICKVLAERYKVSTSCMFMWILTSVYSCFVVVDAG